MLLPARISPSLTGSEKFRTAAGDLPISVLDFWRWHTSDLLSNATRGCLAEFLVATALGIDLGAPRVEWASWDLTLPNGTSDGIEIEVKSSAYLQSWGQTRLSSIKYGVGERRLLVPDSNQYEDTPCRPAKVYVFALLKHQDKATVEPLNLDQWEFYVLATEVLNQRLGSQKSVTLSSLQKLCAAVPYAGIKAAVTAAAGCV
jgi:hypothetical protein